MKQLEHLLLVDDDPTTNFFNKHLVSKINAFKNVHVASNGVEALDLINKLKANDQTPDMILLDINMPIMDGFEFLDHYTKMEGSKDKTVVICMLTTSLAKEDLARAEKYEVLADYIDKPLYEGKILELLEKHFS